MSKPRLYFVTGISGSGKTTIAHALNALGYVALDSKITKGIFHFADANGHVAPDFRPKDKDWTSAYKWVLNVPLLEKTLSQYADAREIFLCGRGNIRQHWDLADKAFLLKVSPETMVARLNRPDRDNQFAKDKATQAKLLESLEFVQRSLTNAGAIVVDAEQPVDDVVQTILSHITE